MLRLDQTIHMAPMVCDTAYVLNEGKVWAEGPVREVARNPEVRRLALSA